MTATDVDPADIDALASAIASASRIVVLTGAGISTESGIPDYRSPGGVWTTQNPIQFDDFLQSESARRTDWERRFALWDQLQETEPNAGHAALTRLYNAGKLATLITQNIDGLHQKSGIPFGDVVEIHGNATYARCLGCGLTSAIPDIRSAIAQSGRSPHCTSCGGLIKAAVISFGQSLDPQVLSHCIDAARKADLFLSIGSSLVVHPAASLPVLAKERGAVLIVINRDPTPIDPIADHVIGGSIGQVLSAVI